MADSTLVTLRMKGDPAPGQAPWTVTGFRLFFLGASALATILVPLWVATLLSGHPPRGVFSGPRWHGHEMLFGYVVAVLAGFFLTAVPKWTGSQRISGAPLVALFLLWLGGRLAVLGPSPAVALGVDVAFLPLLAAAIAWPIYRSGSRRNYGFPPLLLAMAGANLCIHLGWQVVRAEAVALNVAVLIIVIVGGRIIPMFTGNAVPEAAPQRTLWAERATHPLLVALLLADAFVPLVRAPLALLAGAVVLARMSRWGGIRTLREPLVWVLHAGYLWIALGLMIQGLQGLGLPIALDGRHALTAGGIGVLTLGMMARVSLGHTGRPLKVPRPVAAAFVAVNLAAILRVLAVPLGAHALEGAAALWTLAFGAFFILYAPILVGPRADGRPG